MRSSFLHEHPPVEAPGLGRRAQPAPPDGPVLAAAPQPALEEAHEALAHGVRPRVDVMEVRMKWQVRHRVVFEQLVEAATEADAIAVATRIERSKMPLALRPDVGQRGNGLRAFDNGWSALPLAAAGTVPIRKAPRRRPMPRRSVPRTISDHRS